MVADLFHYGHMSLLRRCRELEDNVQLVVGVHSDESCTLYKRTPILTMEERILTLEMSGLVDEVVPDAPFNPDDQFFTHHRIDRMVHAHPIEEDDFYRRLYRRACELGIFERLDYTDTISTSELIRRTRER